MATYPNRVLDADGRRQRREIRGSIGANGGRKTYISSEERRRREEHRFMWLLTFASLVFGLALVAQTLYLPLHVPAGFSILKEADVRAMQVLIWLVGMGSLLWGLGMLVCMAIIRP